MFVFLMRTKLNYESKSNFRVSSKPNDDDDICDYKYIIKKEKMLALEVFFFFLICG